MNIWDISMGKIPDFEILIGLIERLIRDRQVAELLCSLANPEIDNNSQVADLLCSQQRAASERGRRRYRL